MRILGIDTAIPTASVALIQDGELLAEEIHTRPAKDKNGSGFQPFGNHAEVVLTLIESLFEKAQITVQRLSGIAVSIGPGSFTGLRIGLATAKRSEEHTSELQSPCNLVCRLLLEKKNTIYKKHP